MEKQSRFFGSAFGGTADWVRDMHAHYVDKGYYRGADLYRVLGDPRKSVSIPESDAKFIELATAKLHR